LPVLATELCHEIGGKHTCDKRSATSVLRGEYAIVDYSLVEAEEDPFWGDGVTREPLVDLGRRAGQFAEWLHRRPEKQIVIASHSAFLLAIFNAVFATEEETAHTWFGTGEMRAVVLTFSPKE